MRIILIGGGKLAYFLAKRFTGKSYDLTIINENEQEATSLSRKLEARVIIGEGSNSKILQEAGAYRAEVLLAMTPEDQDNLISCQIAQKEYGVPRTVALVNDPDNQEVFEKLGVSVAFSATEIIAGLIEQQAGSKDITNLIPLAEGQVNVTEVDLRKDAPAVGKTLKELELPEDSLVASILRQGEVIIPRGSTSLEAEDRLVVVGRPDNYSQIIRTLTGEEVE